MDTYEIGRLNKIRRSDRAHYDYEAVHAVLDSGLVAHVGFIVDERPVVIPMIYGRSDDTLYLHGAKAARFAKVMGIGTPVCITMTLLDGIVVARSAFHMSMNYRSVVVHGTAHLVTDAEEAERAVTIITDQVLHGRWDEVRPMTQKELNATAVLRVKIDAASLKIRNAPPKDDEEDYALPLWAGVIPLRLQAGTPESDQGVQAPPVSESVKAFSKRYGV